jgi:hypothetical protein
LRPDVVRARRVFPLLERRRRRLRDEIAQVAGERVGNDDPNRVVVDVLGALERLDRFGAQPAAEVDVEARPRSRDQGRHLRWRHLKEPTDLLVRRLACGQMPVEQPQPSARAPPGSSPAPAPP